MMMVMMRMMVVVVMMTTSRHNAFTKRLSSLLLFLIGLSPTPAAAPTRAA
jgi:hypothetical protein